MPAYEIRSLHLAWHKLFAPCFEVALNDKVGWHATQMLVHYSAIYKHGRRLHVMPYELDNTSNCLRL